MPLLFDVLFPGVNESEELPVNKSLTEMEWSEVGLTIHHKVQQFIDFCPSLCAAILTGLIGLLVIDCGVSLIHAKLKKAKVPTVPQNIVDVDWTKTQDIKVNLSDFEGENADEGDGVVVMEQVPVDATVLDFACDVLRVGAKGLLAVVVASMVGIHAESFIAVLTAGSLGVSMALQPMLTDVVKGVIIIVFQPFRKGDLVEIGGLQGFIYDITVFHTLLRSGDNMVHIIPNRMIEAVSNLSAQGKFRHDVEFVISNDEDFQKVKKLMEDTVRKEKMSLDVPPPKILCGGLDDMGTTVVVRAWTLAKDITNWVPVITESVWYMLERERVKMPRHCLIDPPSKKMN